MAQPAQPFFQQPQPQQQALNFTDGRGARQMSGGKDHITCFNCQQKGHYASECSNEQKEKYRIPKREAAGVTISDFEKFKAELLSATQASVQQPAVMPAVSQQQMQGIFAAASAASGAGQQPLSPAVQQQQIPAVQSPGVINLTTDSLGDFKEAITGEMAKLAKTITESKKEKKEMITLIKSHEKTIALLETKQKKYDLELKKLQHTISIEHGLAATSMKEVKKSIVGLAKEIKLTGTKANACTNKLKEIDATLKVARRRSMSMGGAEARAAVQAAVQAANEAEEERMAELERERVAERERAAVMAASSDDDASGSSGSSASVSSSGSTHPSDEEEGEEEEEEEEDEAPAELDADEEEPEPPAEEAAEEEVVVLPQRKKRRTAVRAAGA